MTMKTTKLTTYWEVADASTVIEFLDVLRDQLWEIYGDQIIDWHRQASKDHPRNDEQSELDDDIDF